MDCFRCATISKAILSTALVLGVCGLARAADDKVVDPVGTWKCEYEIGGQQRTSTLKIKKDLFFQMLRDLPQMTLEIMRELAVRLHNVNKELAAAHAKLRQAGLE